MTPWLDDGDLRLYLGDALETVRQLPDESVDCVVTSPPYWGLRDYGTGEWEGGDPDCDHQKERREFASGCVGCGAPMSQTTEGCGHCADRALKRSLRGTPDKDYDPHDPARSDLPNPPAGWAERDATVRSFRDVCGKCGARRVDRQMGLEPTPDLFVAGMVELFREIRRVLAPHGTCWVNLGDSYASAWACDRRNVVGNGSMENGKREDRPNRLVGGLKEKDLVGIPWRVAFALQADGWWLRSDIIWAKPNPMPESVTDRPTKSHEYVFLLTKQPRYWFDTEAVREPHATADDPRANADYQPKRGGDVGGGINDGRTRSIGPSTWPVGGRNVRSVWNIATQPYPEAHFATYPEELARRCILAGCPVRVCRVCGKPSERIVDVSYEKSPAHGAGSVVGRHYETGANNFDGAGMPRVSKVVDTVGWSDCGHNNWRPGTVLDPFIGSGTTAKVARDHQRHAIGIDLNQTYLELAARRLQQLSLLTGFDQ